MRYIVRIAVEANSEDEAVSKRNEGEPLSAHRQPMPGWKKPHSIFPQPVPLDQWPIWAKTMRHFSKPEDKGIGDTVSRMIGDEKSEAFKKWFEATFKKKCGCDGRQATWNVLYPLKPPSA